MPLQTALSEKLGLRYPFVLAPMFIISNKEMIVAAAEAGVLGTMPTLNARTPRRSAPTLSGSESVRTSPSVST